MGIINRFSRPYQNERFKPKSLDELSLVPKAAAQRDATATSLASGIDRQYDVLQQDYDNTSKAIGTLDKDINSFVDDISDRGVTNSDVKRLAKIKRDRDAYYSSTGNVGKAIQAKQAYMQNDADLKKLYDDGKISAEKYQLGLKQALGNYKGAAEGPYQSFTAVQESGYQKKALDLAKAFAANPNVISNYGFRDNGDGTYSEKNGKVRFSRADAIAKATKIALMQDQSVMSDLTQQHQLGIIDANQTLDNLTKSLGAGLSYTQDLSTQDTGFVPGYGKDANTSVNPNDYTNLEEETVGVKTKDPRYATRGYIDRNAGNIGLSTSDYYNRFNKDFNVSKFDVSKDFKYMTPEDKTRYREIIAYQENKTPESITDEMLQDPKVLAKIDNYFKENEFIKFTPRVNTGDYVKAFSNGAVKSKTRASYLEDAANDYSTRYFINKETGKREKATDLFDDKQDFKAKVGLIGELNSTNLYGSGIDTDNEDIKESVLTSPFIIQVDGKQYLMSRSIGEMNTPEYKAETAYNNVFNKSMTQPGITQEYKISNNESNKIQWNPNTGYFKITLGDGYNTHTRVLTQEQLHDYILLTELNK